MKGSETKKIHTQNYLLWKDARNAYLMECNIKETDIKKRNIGTRLEYFLFDGHIIYVPDYLITPTAFARHLKNNPLSTDNPQL